MRPDLVAGFEAARELLHLLDDNINDDDDDDDDRRHRRDDNEERCCLDVVSFARANDKYIESFDGTFLPVARYCQRVAAKDATTTTTTTTTTNDDGDDDDGEKGSTAAARATLELYRVLSRANEYANATKLRIPANSRCSVSVERIDLSPLIEQQRRPPRNNSDGDTAATLGRLLNRRVVPSDQTSYTYLEAYIAYSPMVHRFDSLSALIARWNERHSTIEKDEPNDDEFLRCVLLPSRGVWQSGTSQILWIVMHTLAALTVQRRNRYVHRALAVLEHLSFYVWCADCSMHWRSNRGDDYFRHVSTLTRLNRLPIDILLLRCHNAVNGNSSSSLLVTPPPTSPVAVAAAIDDRDGFASKWTLANLCLDYRDFAAIGLLKRGDRESSRAHRANLCRPMVRAIERINGSSGRAAEDADSPDYLLSLAIVDSGATATAPPPLSPRDPTTAAMQHLLFGALKQQYGEALLRKLWHDIDPSLTVPVCAMY